MGKSSARAIAAMPAMVSMELEVCSMSIRAKSRLPDFSRARMAGLQTRVIQGPICTSPRSSGAHPVGPYGCPRWLSPLDARPRAGRPARVAVEAARRYRRRGQNLNGTEPRGSSDAHASGHQHEASLHFADERHTVQRIVTADRLAFDADESIPREGLRRAREASVPVRPGRRRGAPKSNSSPWPMWFWAGVRPARPPRARRHRSPAGSR